jgi:hypothetical protein
MNQQGEYSTVNIEAGIGIPDPENNVHRGPPTTVQVDKAPSSRDLAYKRESQMRRPLHKRVAAMGVERLKPVSPRRTEI